MGAESVPSEVLVSCDGPGCAGHKTTTDTADPTPAGWLAVWGPPERLGRFYFCCGVCYDAWLAEPPPGAAA